MARISRRPFLWLLGSTLTGAAAGCGENLRDWREQPLECDEKLIQMYDSHAQALYLDGTLGPLTGVIYVDYIIGGEPVTLDFWHGHGGQSHRYTLEPEHFELLKQGERVYIETTEVQSHSHMLYIDPLDEELRVEGAEPVDVVVDIGITGCIELAPLEVELPKHY